MIFILFFLFERIKKPIGEANYLPRLVGINLTQLISKNPFCVIFYTSNTNTRFDYVNFAITKFYSKIKFATASINESIAPKIKTNFIAVPYKNGHQFETTVAPTTAIQFSNWCDKIIRPSIVRINHIDQLRRAFREPGVSLFGVDMISRPSYIKDSNIQFYLINHTLFNYLGLTVKAGLYVYRSSDRQLVKAGENYRNFLKSSLIDFSEEANLGQYYGGFFVDRENINKTQAESSILTKLAHQFKTIKFGLIEGEIAAKISMLSQIQFIKRPFFVLFKGENYQDRYVTFSEDIESITQFIQSVLDGKQKSTKISGSADEISISYNSFHSIISDEQKSDILVIFSNSLHRRSTKYLFNLAKRAIELIEPKGNRIELYRYDLSENEIPDGVQIEAEGGTTASLVLFPKGKIGEELYYEGDESMTSMIDFISSGVSFKCEIPDFDENEILNEIIEKVEPKAFKDNLSEEREKREKAEL